MGRAVAQQSGLLGFGVAVVVLVCLVLAMAPSSPVKADAKRRGTLHVASGHAALPVNDDFRFHVLPAYGGTGADPCPEDIDGNGFVDTADLVSLLAAWGPCKGCPEDIDESGVVDTADLVALLAAWGACP
jgi:hypothetical protein